MEQTQGSAKLERASRTLPHLSINIVFVGGTQTTRRHWSGRNHENSKEIHTCEAGAGFCFGTRATSHTPCREHYSNGTLIDKRNGQKGMLGTRIIHVLCF